jgi:hypothetical protein
VHSRWHWLRKRRYVGGRNLEPAVQLQFVVQLDDESVTDRWFVWCGGVRSENKQQVRVRKRATGMGKCRDSERYKGGVQCDMSTPTYMSRSHTWVLRKERHAWSLTIVARQRGRKNRTPLLAHHTPPLPVAPWAKETTEKRLIKPFLALFSRHTQPPKTADTRASWANSEAGGHWLRVMQRTTK